MPPGMTMTGSYDARLVALSVAIAILASYTALDLARRVTAARDRMRVVWLAGGAMAMGLGIWSMHFIGMLAFRLAAPVSYNLPTVLVSLLVAIGVAALALVVVSRPSLSLVAWLGGGSLMGLGIAAMHYSGMAALRMPLTLRYAPVPLTLSLVIAVGASLAALGIAFRLRAGGRRKLTGASAVVMGVAITGMHYTGMAAAIFTMTAGSAGLIDPTAAAPLLVAVAVAIATLVVLGFALLASLVDQYLAARAVEVEALRRSEERLQALSMRLRRVQEMGQALHLELDVAGIAQLVVDGVCAALGYGLAALNLIDDLDRSLAEQRIQPVAVAGLTAEDATVFLAQDAPASDVLTLWRAEFQVSRSYVLPAACAAALMGTTALPRVVPVLTTTAVGGWQAGDELFVPLVERRTGRFMGFLSLDAPVDGRRPDAAVIDVLEIVADQVALALENSRLYEQAQTLARRDPVTGLANHRAVWEALDVALVGRAGTAVLLLDVDNFKHVNDTHGHLVGDDLLRAVGTCILSCLREGDVAGRQGGDEFTVVLPGMDRATADGVAARIARAIAAYPSVDAEGAAVPLTVSIGVAATPEDGRTLQALLAVADARMYAYKRGAALVTPRMHLAVVGGETTG